MVNTKAEVMEVAGAVKTLRNFIDGRWRDAEADGYLDVENPGTGKTLARVPLSTAAEVDRAVAAAKKAFADWSRTPVSARCAPLYKLREQLCRHGDSIAHTIVAEMGKSLPDARAELKRNIENCEVACGMPSLIQGDNIINAAAGIDGEVLRMPIGVFGAIVPFNFPAMVPFWFLPCAVAAGNTFVLKCSEQAPLTMQKQFELIESCGFPPGVVNLVNGDKVAGEALVNHRDVAGISFVGSSRVARIVAQDCARTGKRCQAMGSAKNYLVVMPDAQMDQVVRNMLTSCLGCAGQRCMAASAIACVGADVYETVVQQFTDAARGASVGNPLDPALSDVDLVVGPVISAAAQKRIEDLIQTGIDEGAQILLDGRGVTVDGCEDGHYVGPTILADVKPGMTVEKTEIFGPVVIIMKFDNLDQAIDAINQHEFGNGASIYTQSGYWARKFKLEALAGMIGINVGIPAPVACLPFGGTKASLCADVKAQGKEVVNFFTEKKIVTERYWPQNTG
jgi:malonate-semialdehyde dehydrogenase (acetylating)/methylmalonate-semialdehyde dehydrogenase